MDEIRTQVTPTPSVVIMDKKLCAEHLQTYSRLLALAWRHDHKHTDWVTIEDLLGVLGDKQHIDRATFFRYIKRLKELGLIDWSTDDKKRYRFRILEVRLSSVAQSQNCDPTTTALINTLSPDEIVEVESQKCDQDLIDQEAFQILLKAGIAKAVAHKLCLKPSMDARYARAQAARARQKAKMGKGSVASWLITFIRDEDPIPEGWCERCDGLDGKHTDACPTRAERASAAIAELDRIEEQARLQEPAPEVAPQEARAAMDMWEQTLGDLRFQVTEATFEAWLRRTRALEFDGTTFVVGVHNEQAGEWLEGRMKNLVKRSLSEVVGNSVEVRFVVER